MPINILLIEDNLDHIEITKRVLQETGQDYQVDSATDARSGLSKIFQGSYDAILCDYRLPDSTALEILREMNEKENTTPFIAVTSLGNEKVAVDIMKEGAYDYIVKDALYQDTLGMVIKKALDRYRMKEEKMKLEGQVREAYERLKETQGQLIQAEKINVIGQLASSVAHEVRNPLGVILQGVNYLESKISAKEGDILEVLTMLKDNISRADKIINSLLDFSRVDSLNLKAEDINSILEASLTLVKASRKLENIDVIMETKKDLPVILADKNKLEQVFINLLLNAIQAMPDGGKIIVRSYAKQLEEVRDGVGMRAQDTFQIGEKAVIVEIQDTGVGIPEGNLKKIFEPFFTSKGPGVGVGLGLSVTRNIIDMHKGLIDIESQVDKGSKVVIIFKIAVDRI
jgi:signal transduction histidine kinase